MIIAGTGHRPNKLGGYGDKVFQRLVDLGRYVIREERAQHVISGMALGWDQALAQAALELKVPFTAAVPFEGQESMWPISSQGLYRELLSKAEKVIIVCDGGYSAAAMQKRNAWMVDHADQIAALWDGSSGGTGNCLAYARKREVGWNNYWALWVKHSGFFR
jgi:uncharacterized phage-like protein YoqJ